MIARWGLAAGVLVVVVVALVLGLGGPGPLDTAVAASTDMTTPGSLNVMVLPGQKLRSCPLEHTEVEGWIAGDVASVCVTQRFGNPYDEPIEAIYVFPLPANAAVDEMEMRVGERIIRGLIKEREEAKQIYEEARAAGKTTSLLEQERPNIFTQSVANIMPGDAVEITIWYVQDLTYDKGSYEFTFPMVVGPRYIPGGALPGPDTGGGWSPDTDQVPDASRITPPVLTPDERTGHDISLTLHLDAGVQAYDLACKSHDTVVDSYGGTPMVVSLEEHDTIPNKDFSLSWRVAGERSEVGVLSHHDDRAGYFMLVLQPKAEFAPEEITPKEMIFCLDTSGSMSGLPIEKSKEAVLLCLEEMGPHDTFQVIRFAGDSSTFAPKPVPATRANIERAAEFIESMRGSGGTEMLQGIEASLGEPADPKRLRIVAFLTDGYIGNESEILARIEAKLGTARIFSFGVGSSVNRHLLKKMGQLGRGTAQFVRQDEDPEAAVRSFVDRISRPYLTDVEIDWGGLDVVDIYPPYVPDLFADQPVILHGRYDHAGEGLVRISGQVAGEPWWTAVRVSLAAEPTEHEVLATLWARAAIDDMMDQMYGGEDPELVDAITDLALTYGIVSKYTSFVAVEEKIVNRGGEQVTVQVPVPMPEGVSYEGVFGALNGEHKASLRAYGYASGGRGGGMGGARGGGGMRGAPGPTSTPRPLLPAQHLGRPADAVQLGDLAEESDLLSPVYLQAWLWVATPSPAQDDWQAEINLIGAARREIGLPGGGVTVVQEEHLSALGDAENLKMLLLNGDDAAALTEEVMAALVAYVERGGFVIVDTSSEEFRSRVRAALGSSVKGARRGLVPTDHAVFAGESMPFTLEAGGPVAPSDGLWIGDRLAVFASSADLLEAWREPLSPATRAEYELGINLIAYALQTAP